MYKAGVFILALLFSATGTFAQAPRKVVVEHFTNSLCSVCASRNPGLYTNLDNYPDVVHIAYHPSAPYKNCLLNKHNVQANDERTRTYGIFGSTPRIVVQGKAVSSASDYSSPALFSAELGKTSPFAIHIREDRSNPAQISILISVLTMEDNSYDSLRLYAALAEDTVWYDAPNGEKLHYDVMRQPLFGNTGAFIQTGKTSGDSTYLEVSVPYNSAWQIGQLETVAVLQEPATNVVLQAETTKARRDATSGIRDIAARELQIFPNPVAGTLMLQADKAAGALYIYNMQGQLVQQLQVKGNAQIDMEAYPDGVYLLKLMSGSGLYTGRVVVRH